MHTFYKNHEVDINNPNHIHILMYVLFNLTLQTLIKKLYCLKTAFIKPLAILEVLDQETQTYRFNYNTPTKK